MTAMLASPFLTSDLPTSVGLDGKQVSIYTGYRRGVKALQAAESGSNDAAAQLPYYFFDMNTLEALTERQLKELTGVLDWWLRCGQRKRRRHDSGKRRLWSWSQDTDAVVADFQRFYRIDLVAVRDMHWWHFTALFDNLPKESESAMRMYWRGPCPKGASKEEQAHHNLMRRHYALKEM